MIIKLEHVAKNRIGYFPSWDKTPMATNASRTDI